VGKNLVVMGRSQKERKRGRGFGFLAVRVIEGRSVSVLRMEMERAVCGKWVVEGESENLC
jgi:hypothetical protein